MDIFMQSLNQRRFRKWMSRVSNQSKRSKIMIQMTNCSTGFTHNFFTNII